MLSAMRILALVAAFAALAGPARAAAVSASWTPPFEPAAPALAAGLKDLAASPEGRAELPRQLGTFFDIAKSETPNYAARVTGAVAARLTPEFQEALASGDKARATSLLKTALDEAAPALEASARERLAEIEAGYARGELTYLDLGAAQNQIAWLGALGPGYAGVEQASRALHERVRRAIVDKASAEIAAELAAQAKDDVPAGGTAQSRPDDVEAFWKLLKRRPSEVEVSAFLAALPTPNVVGPRGDSLLHVAAFHQNFAAVRGLVRAGASTSLLNERGETPLSSGAQTYNEYMHDLAEHVKVLAYLAAKSPLGKPDEQGLTELHHALMGFSVAAAEILIRAGSPVDARTTPIGTEKGLTAREIAVGYEYDKGLDTPPILAELARRSQEPLERSQQKLLELIRALKTQRLFSMAAVVDLGGSGEPSKPPTKH